MDVYEAIEKRRTIRIYKNPASEEQLRKIILAGTKAPHQFQHGPVSGIQSRENFFGIDGAVIHKTPVSFRQFHKGPLYVGS